MKRLNEILQELGISKVKLAKYLGVSRQMIYNYLELDSLNKWPKEKKILLFRLLNISDGNEKTLNRIKITSNYILEVESRLNQSLCDYSIELDTMNELKFLNKSEQQLFSNLTYLIKDKLTEDYKHEENVAALTYIYHILQEMDNEKDMKYLLGYMSKTTGYTDPKEFSFDPDKQFIFEGIIHYAVSLFANGGVNKSKIIQSHARFVQEMRIKKEERLSRTQQLDSLKVQALNELNCSKVTKDNHDDFIAKLVELQSKKS